MLISVGYEYETQYINLVEREDNSIHNKDEYELKRFNIIPERFNIYADEFKSNTTFDKEKKKPFLKNLERIVRIKADHITLQTLYNRKYTKMTIPNNDKVWKEFFKHCEFVLTFPEPKEIERSELMSHIITYCIKGIKKIEKFVGEFEVNAITRSFPDDRFYMDLQFPYNYMLTNSKYNDFVLLTFEDPKKMASHYRFVIQCTIGVKIYDCEYAITELTKEFIRCGGSEGYNITELVTYYVDLIMKNLKNITDKELIRNYLFLFVYNYMTFTDRKARALFIIRHLMAEIAEQTISSVTKKKIYMVMHNNDTIPTKMTEYFYDIHYVPVSDKYNRKLRQNILDVTAYDVKEKMILIEFRGLKTILDKYFAKKRELHLQDVIVSKKIKKT